MTLSQLFILAFLALLVGRLKRGRSLILLGSSAFIIYWLQPMQKDITLTYWLPTATLAITVLIWLLTSSPEVRSWKQNYPAILILSGVVLLFDLNRYFKLETIFTAATPRPQWLVILLMLLVALGFWLSRFKEPTSLLFVLATAAIILLFVVIKTPLVFSRLFDEISRLREKDVTAGIDFSWLGFSYVAFRLLHTILDRKAGRLPAVPLAEYVNYVIFFPSFSAGPLDRLEHFTQDLRHPKPLENEEWIEAGRRFILGLFKKFVIADTLALVALNEVFARQIDAPSGLWLLLYGYSFQIYFDFSGYTDMAIGLGRLMGIRLPENFAAPYLKPNLTQFWASWHMTLTQWFRSYLFNPLTRFLRANYQTFPSFTVILFTQLTTMVTIGLWHGITASFVCWGLWHGIGLFVQNRWSDFARGRFALDRTPRLFQNTLKYVNVLLTFHYVALGWLFFLLPEPGLAAQTMLKLLGFAR